MTGHELGPPGFRSRFSHPWSVRHRPATELLESRKAKPSTKRNSAGMPPIEQAPLRLLGDCNLLEKPCFNPALGEAARLCYDAGPLRWLVTLEFPLSRWCWPGAFTRLSKNRYPI